MSHCRAPTALHRTFFPRQLRPAPAINCARANPPRHHIDQKPTNQTKQQHHTHQQRQQLIISSVRRSVLACQEESARPEMGSCFSSSGSASEDAPGYGDERRVPKVWPDDDDGGEWDVDNRAAIYIAKFHRHQSGVVCSDCADQQQQQQQAPAATAAQ